MSSRAALATDAGRSVLRAPSDTARGLKYSVSVAPLPDVESLPASQVVPTELVPQTEAPARPAGVVLPTDGPLWRRFDALRRRLLNNAVSAGAGRPIGVTAARTVEVLDGGRATPFELAAAQALLARWLGLPSRIGFGYDGGFKEGELLVVNEFHGGYWPEIWLGARWLPVIGTTKHAERCPPLE